MLLEDIAKEGGGRALFTRDPNALPRLFAQDTFAVARSTFLDEPTPIRQTSGYSLISGPHSRFGSQTLGGYNLCYLRNGAFLGAQTLDEYKAPVIAGWNVGAGRVAAYTGEVDGKYTGTISKSADYGEILTSITRWCAGEYNPLSNGMMLQTDINNGTCRIELWLDPERETTILTTTPTVQLLRSTESSPSIKEKHTMQWQNADLLTAEILLNGNEVVLPIVYIDGESPQPQPPITLPYSAEYNPQQSGRGIETLKRLANITDGTERLRLGGIWDTLPHRTTYKSLQPWLLLLSIVLFLLEIIIRRSTLPKLIREKLNQHPTPNPTASTIEQKQSKNKNITSESTTTQQPTTDETNSAIKRAAKRSKERLRR